ncbi:class A beta-lactamase-related serine hydrolase [Brevundimonas naejangsanensis]|uniref:Class A beta-lactamase-related serine hydrolase n=1 Tax=Brevundimonas naejangsanensis TaxID=588932 RepID=A0A494RL33_9CAUL|nr:serine hydrolase domain-containing protein [Brevundimonas naejangsanensis]AYG96179.1 class A beta-lactamase-related serine hydrolase [Brevundimonas naejangsanensis]
MFIVPKTAGGKPWFLGSLVAVGLISAGAGAWLVHAVAPETQAATVLQPKLPKRPPVQVVEELPQLKARLDHLAERKQFMGAVLVAKGDQVLFRQVYGKANYEQDQPLALDTRFRLASVSKQFTAAAVLTLQDQGKLSVDDPVCKWIDPCPDAWQPLRIHHLLSHTSGIPDLMAQAEWGRIRVTPRTPEELTQTSARYRLQFQPGTKIRYDNAAYNLAADIVAKASGMPFETYLEQAILKPLGLKDTGSDAKADAQGLAMGYGLFPGGLTPQPIANVSVVFGAGALYSTLDDMLAWNRALHRGHLLSETAYAQMVADHAPENTPKERGRPHRAYGYGLYVNNLGRQVSPAFDDRQIYHTGSWAGFRNLVLYQPEADVTVVVLSNNYHLRDQVFMISQQAMAEALGRPFPTGLHR